MCTLITDTGGLARTNTHQGWPEVAEVVFFRDRQDMTGETVTAVLVAGDGATTPGITFETAKRFIDGVIPDHAELAITCYSS